MDAPRPETDGLNAVDGVSVHLVGPNHDFVVRPLWVVELRITRVDWVLSTAYRLLTVG